MAISAITPRVSTAAPTASPIERGRFSYGHECLPYVGRVGSFADGQCGPAVGAELGRFSTGQHTAASASDDRIGSFADGTPRVS
jgi:hypothetical protein